MSESIDADDLDPGELAQAAGDSMYARDRASRELGITLDEIRPGYARMSMTVEAWMIQGHTMCHGGLLFALADTAMAFASNSHNQQHLALHANIDYLRPAKVGDTLTAEATEGNRTKRMGVYNVSIVNGDGKAVCHFRGRTYGVGGSVIREAEPS
ncbi:MAG: hydroxyphenylacetyl-CoA thioesterase PaaI [Gammaproteobacteria bacterium]|nr:hydroxyphenylacetyl-CoA thioesterase PaaI [Gammaproteobacteria bacterium]